MSYQYETLKDFLKVWRPNPVTGEQRPFNELTDEIVWQAARSQLPTTTASTPFATCPDCGGVMFSTILKICKCGFKD